jgi:hypothetical protein
MRHAIHSQSRHADEQEQHQSKTASQANADPQISETHFFPFLKFFSVIAATGEGREHYLRRSGTPPAFRMRKGASALRDNAFGLQRY